MSFPAYPEYQDAGVQWLGPLPKHWAVERVTNLYREAVEAGTEDLPILSVSIHTGVSDEESNPSDSDRKVTRSDDRTKYKRVQPNDLVYNMMRAWQGGFGAVQVPGMVSPAYVVARPRGDVPSKFVELLLRTSGAMEEMRRRSRGVTDFRLRLYWDEFKDIHIALPPAAERRAIVVFVERETAKIDALVAEQERLIALLKEKRHAVISHAVTKGLKPHAPMKDSGIEWLGEIPAHWDVRTVGYLCEKISYGFTNPMPTADDGPFMLTANDIGDRRIRYETARRTEVDAFRELLTDKSRPQIGDVLLTKDGTLGRVAVFDGAEACINQSVALLRPAEGISSEFLAHALADGVYQTRMIYEAGGTTIKHIYISRLAKMSFATPPLDEIDDLVAFCNEHQKIADNLERSAQAAITLLQERRAALISAAVTGKIDVRGLVDQQELEAA